MAQQLHFWQKFASKTEEQTYADSLATAADVKKDYEAAIRNLQKDINYWYSRFASASGITMADAKKILNSDELKEARMTAKEYEKAVREHGGDPNYRAFLKAMSARHRITRLELLQMQCRQHIEDIKASEVGKVGRMCQDTYKETYYRYIYGQSVTAGFVLDFAHIDEKQLNKVINEPWGVQSRNYRTDIVRSNDVLFRNVNKALIQGCIGGYSYDKMAKMVTDRMKVGYSSAYRRIRTEANHYANIAARDSYKALGATKYQVDITFDDRTCETCQEFDGKVIDLNDYEEGVTAPPFHINCRCMTVPYTEGIVDPYETHAARDENGKTIFIPDSMSYQEWKAKYGSK